MKIAILIANSDYYEVPKLKACENDIKILEAIIRNSNKYDEIIPFQNLKSLDLKDKLSQKVASLSEKPIQELFLYYTGHGLYKDNQFFYLPIDYSEKKHNTTSLSNEELDGLIKTLKPELTIKLIDACESATNYVKAIKEETEKYINSTKSHFDKCYFMFSSQNNQNSYQTDKLSWFTKAFIFSLISCTNQSIRYKDIMSYIADYFQNINLQTPFFVNQAKLTEIFIDDLLPVKEGLKNFYDILELTENIENNKIENNIPEETCTKNLLKLIRKDSENYIIKEQAMGIISNILKLFSEIALNKELADFYQIKATVFESITGLTNVTKLFQEINDRKNDFYITINTVEEEYEEEIKVPKRKSPLYSSFFTSFNIYEEYDLKTVTRKRTVVSGFEHSLKTPGSGYSLKTIPAFPNINMFVLNIFFIFNNKDIVFYYNKIEYTQKNWSDWAIQSVGKWETIICPFKDEDFIYKSLNKLINDWQNDVYNKISNKFVK